MDALVRDVFRPHLSPDRLALLGGALCAQRAVSVLSLTNWVSPVCRLQFTKTQSIAHPRHLW